MQKPKSMGMMSTQPLTSTYTDYSKVPYNLLFPDRHSALSLQIGSSTYSQHPYKQKRLNQKNKTADSNLSQKAKNRSASNKMFVPQPPGDAFNVRYNKYHQIYAQKHHGPIKAMQKKNEKLVNRMTKIEEVARNRKNSRRSNSRKGKRPTSPKMDNFYGNIQGEQRKFIRPSHQKIVSATNGFEAYKAERIYSESRHGKQKQKRATSKKQQRIR